MREIHIMTEAEWEELVDAPFNPPNASISDDDFEIEFSDVEDRLREILDRFGKHSAYGEGDFYLELGFCRSRGMGFEISPNSSLEHPELVPSIESLLKILPEQYDISVQSDNFDFYLYISSDRIAVFTDDFKRLSKFGLTGKKCA